MAAEATLTIEVYLCQNNQPLAAIVNIKYTTSSLPEDFS